jgi:hypothetical protein
MNVQSKLSNVEANVIVVILHVINVEVQQLMIVLHANLDLYIWMVNA